MTVDEAQYRDIATPEDIDWLLSTLVPGTKHMAVFNNMGPGTALPDMVANLRGDESDKARVTEWLSIPNVRLFAQLDVRTLYISPDDIVFMRTKLPAQLKQQEVKVKQLDEYRIRYEEDAKTARIVADELRAKMAENQRGPAVNDIRDQLLSWPQVFDFKVGPCWDSMSRTVIPANTMVVSFIPVLYDGDDIPNIGPATTKQGGGHRWAPTTPIRLILNEAGTLTGFTGNAATFHPHILGDRVCQGNLTRLLSVMLRENNVTGAADCLRQYSVSHHLQDWMDRTFAAKSWNWWNKHVIHGEETWRLGSWDGKTVSVAGDNTPIVNIEEFLGGPLEDIFHVASVKKYVTPTMIQAYIAQKPAVATTGKGYCRMSGHPLLDCACHNAWCSASMTADFLCTTDPIDNFIPVPHEYTSVDGSRVRYLWQEEYNQNVACEYVRTNGTYCGVTAEMRRLTGRGITWMCAAHVPAEIKATITERVKTLSEMANRFGTGITGTIRHHHEHDHPTGYGGVYKHSHHHEHPKEHVASELIQVHDRNHNAFRGAHTGTSILRHRRYMN